MKPRTNKTRLALLISIVLAIIGTGGLTFRSTNLAPALGPPEEVRIELGTADDGYEFVPNKLEFERRRLYKLLITNPSSDTHYFSSPNLAASVETRKVVTRNVSGLAAEVKGMIREIEIFPGGSAEWWLVPVLGGTFRDLHCSNVDGNGRKHVDLGMAATIKIN